MEEDAPVSNIDVDSEYEGDDEGQRAEDDEFDRDMDTDEEDERQNELDLLAKEAEMDLDEVVKGYVINSLSRGEDEGHPEEQPAHKDKDLRDTLKSGEPKNTDEEGGSASPSNGDEDSDGSESSFDEFSVGIALELPKRANRSKKYTTLVGEELEKDQQFWEHSTWNEEQEDDDYVCSEGESFYEYETDSDFDAAESSEEEEVVEKVERKKRFKAKSYIDPALQRHKKQHIAPKPQSEVKKQKTTIPFESNIMFRSKRDTTIRKTEAVIAKNEREKLFSEVKKKVKRPIHNRKLPTQEELLEEAERVEAMNKESLEALLATEIEKKRYTKFTRQKAKGHYDIWISWNSLVSVVSEDVKEPIVERELEMYFFTDGKIPEMYEQEVDLEPKTILCPITGNKAKYIDPLTKVPFDSTESFKRIREIAARRAAREEQEENLTSTTEVQ